MRDFSANLRTFQLDALGAAIQRDIDAALYDGMAVGIRSGGETVYQQSFGFADRRTGRKLDGDDVFAILSFTKVFTALGIFQAIERGDLSLTTRVADVLPGFGANGKQNITIAQLMSHTGGMPFTLPGLTPEMQGDLRMTVDLACQIAPVNPPGEVVSYSAQVSYDVLGGVIEALDSHGRHYREIIADQIFRPLNMSHSAIGAHPDIASRRVPIVARNETPMNLALMARDAAMTETSELPGGGGYASLDDMLNFVAMLEAGGVLDSRYVVSPAALELARSNHTGLRPNNTLAAQREMRGLEPYPAYLGLGFFLRGEGLFPMPFGQFASAETYGSIGAGSMVFWCDPNRNLSAVFLSSGLMDQVDSHLRYQRLSDMVHAALEPQVKGAE
ncbi:beta-lactamase family protein [Hoeflea sp. WL0058]|uniref:Beta-lactamase family protein n=1 Tax=Flavimaribacter sediminis TaxID=2865987 RepID=A0AAE3D238_9HYPH|nr:serine hydrolase domain-containing protein [Flavimaribacter sediminis]MBW8638707.1 beta-lactamase family protein [Flavimaribacter sediminis]